MSKRMTLAEVKKLPEPMRSQIMEQLNESNINAGTTWGKHSKSKRSKRKALGVAGKAPERMVNIDCPVLVRITRVSPRTLDDDNFSGGSKEIRDAIASALGRKGDSEKDGMRWEYVQEKGKHLTRIEIFKDNNEETI